MPLEVATYINGLDSANPTPTDPKSQGDDHLRMVKSTLKATFPNLAGPVTPSHTEMNYLTGVGGNVRTGGDLRNLLINGSFIINQRATVSGVASTAANQVGLDRWRTIILGQNVTFGAPVPDRTVTCPAGGIEQIIEGNLIFGGSYTLSWLGTATAKVNGVAIANGASTSVLPANTAVSVQFASGTVTLAQFELGSVATPFQRRPMALELQLCQRDFAKSYAYGTAAGTAATIGRAWGSGNISGTLLIAIPLPMPMRSTPSILLWDQDGNGASASTYSAAGVITSRAASAINVGDSSFEILTSAGGTDVTIAAQWSASTGF